jgi:hypothetical protein
MKFLFPIYILFIYLLVTGLQPIMAQNIAINSSGAATADASAILDVQSTNKGLLIAQINLSSLTAASPLTSPAHSLLVYNTNASITGGIGYYYNSGDGSSPKWVKLGATDTDWKITGNTGNDSASNFLGTTDVKPFVLKTNNTSRINISADGITTIGGTIGDTKFENDGTILMEDSATVWDDLKVALDNGTNGAQIGSLSGLTGPQIWFFKDGEGIQAMSFTVQLPHGWKEGSYIFPHLHWSPKETKSGNVEWNLEYSWANYNAATPEVFPDITTSTVVATGGFTASKHLITALTANNVGIDGSGKKISSVLICRIWRKSSNTNDTYSADAGVISLDFHLQLNTIGSRSEYAK